MHRRVYRSQCWLNCLSSSNDPCTFISSVSNSFFFFLFFQKIHLKTIKNLMFFITPLHDRKKLDAWTTSVKWDKLKQQTFFLTSLRKNFSSVSSPLCTINIFPWPQRDMKVFNCHVAKKEVAFNRLFWKEHIQSGIHQVCIAYTSHS